MPSDFKTELAHIITNSLKFWEFYRLIYNGILAVLVVCGAFYFQALGGTSLIELVALSFFGAIGANLLYCAAYPVDVFVQLSTFRPIWLRHRIWLFVMGTGIAAILALISLAGLGSDLLFPQN